MKSFFKSIRNFGRKNPARIYSFASITAIYISKKIPGLPMEVVILAIAAFFGLGESVQQIENKKTKEALFTEPPKGENNG